MQNVSYLGSALFLNYQSIFKSCNKVAGPGCDFVINNVFDKNI